MLKREDFKRRKQLHDKIVKFKNQQKLERLQKDYENEEQAFGNFEQRIQNHIRTVSRNEEIIKKMKKKETEYMDKLKQTLDKHKSMTESFYFSQSQSNI